jgi:lysine 6-dehydrogenase
MMGSTIAWDLVRSDDVDSVLVGDLDEERLEALRRRCGKKKKLKTEDLDVVDSSSLRTFMQGQDVIVSALPHGILHTADLTAVRAGVRLVNIAFEDEQMAMNDLAMTHGSLLIPGAGLAPGLSAVLAAEGARQLGVAHEGHILVGGLPQKPQPPLNYRLVFSVKGLIREYLSARVIREGKIENVTPFDIIEHHRFPKPIGMLEAFYTDGLGSALYSMRDFFSVLDEKTLRWPGHGEKIRFLRDAGFFSEESFKVGKESVSPMDITSRVLYRILTRGEPKDVTVMRVEVLGPRDGRRAEIKYEMIDYYDEENEITSMGRTTGYTAAIIARMVGRGDVKGMGVHGPESILNGEMVGELIRELGGKGVKITCHRTDSTTKKKKKSGK